MLLEYDIKERSIFLKMTFTELFFIFSNISILSYIIFERLYSSNKLDIKYLNDAKRKKILVTGGAGFVGSNLVDRLMTLGHEVIVIDNMFTGRTENCQHWIGHPHFRLIYHDITQPIYLEVDEIYHLACPASPPHYQYNLIKTIKTCTIGTLNMLGLAKRVNAKILLTSTSEVYGDPLEHPQSEDYWGNVNTFGPRSSYDEGKRIAETMMYAYKHQEDVDIRIARIFNTFGPRMHPNDGRVVSNFIIQALQNHPITIYGDGQQTRSFQYIDDLVDGLILLMNSNYTKPVNIGNPIEYTIQEFANMILKMVNGKSIIRHLPSVKDDPSKRKPDISTAKRELNWQPSHSIDEGLSKTIHYFKKELQKAGEINPTGPDPTRPFK
jgi:UDP-glucuronate decarboxylase